MSPSWLEELEARLEEQLEGFLRANPRQEELLTEQEDRDRQLSLRQERLALQQQAEATRQRLLELAREIRLWQQRRDKASAAGATDLATKAAAHLNGLMEQGRGDWQHLTELGQRFASVEAALDALNKPSPSGTPNRGVGTARQTNSGTGSAPAGATAGSGGTADSSARRDADTNSGTSRHEPGPARSASGAAGREHPPVDPAVDLEAAWHAFATQQELEELRRRVGS